MSGVSAFVRRRRVKGRRWRSLRLSVLERDGYKCVRCRRNYRLEVDHIKPVSEGGAEFDAANCQTLCRNCHLAKHDGGDLLEERRQWRKYLDGITDNAR